MEKTKSKEKKTMTLAYVCVGNRILLGKKKKEGFGYSKWNGLGGKVEPGESIEEAMKREVYEEGRIKVKKYSKIGMMTFCYVNDPMMEVHIFRIDNFDGKESHSDEMEVKWFDIKSPPFSEMWPNDSYWWPFLLVGKKFRGEFSFNKHYQIVDHQIQETDNF